MALALNIYKTKVGIASVTTKEIYKAPVGYTGVILCSNISNVGANTRSVSLTHNRTLNNVGTMTTTVTEFFKDFPLEPNDSLSAIKGKLFLEPGDSVKITASVDNEIKYVFSILETLN
jgi:hypothetical protein